MISLGLGTTINNRLSSAGFSAEYQAILTAGSGYTQPNATEQALQNQLIIDLKSAGIWAKLDAFYMFANNITDSTGAFARINWKNPSANYADKPVGGALPSISPKSGFTGNGTTQSLSLNFAANSGINFVNPNGSYGVKLGTASLLTANAIMGASASFNKIRQSVTGIPSSMQISGASFDGQIFADNSFIHLNRKTDNTSANTGIYVNGTRTQGFGAAWQTDTQSFFILRYGDTASYGNSQVKLAFVGGDLSAEAATFNTLISNYITAVNAL